MRKVISVLFVASLIAAGCNNSNTNMPAQSAEQSNTSTAQEESINYDQPFNEEGSGYVDLTGYAVVEKSRCDIGCNDSNSKYASFVYAQTNAPLFDAMISKNVPSAGDAGDLSYSQGKIGMGCYDQSKNVITSSTTEDSDNAPSLNNITGGDLTKLLATNKNNQVKVRVFVGPARFSGGDSACTASLKILKVY